MTDPCPQNFIDFAAALAEASGPVLRRHFRTPVAIDLKADESPVTIADRDAEAAMRALIEERFPDHGIVGEEFGNLRADADYVWVLDPIDGTRAFITGRPMFGTLIALVRNGAPILGVIDQPVTGERWVGAEGRPTTFNGAPAKTRHCPALKDAVLSTTSPALFSGEDSARFARLSAAVRDTNYGGDCYAYGLVASGFIDVVAEAGLKPFDFCALAPVLAGAGGAMTDWGGRALTLQSDGRVIAVGDPALLVRAVEALAD
jgi:inositol-phosphate phosphatase/L-galactose 1-phosphate phosphatase/histidinol-phosphatase